MAIGGAGQEDPSDEAGQRDSKEGSEAMGTQDDRCGGSFPHGITRGRYTIIGLNPDKIWDINNNVVTLKTDKKKIKIKTNPLKYLNKLFLKLATIF